MDTVAEMELLGLQLCRRQRKGGRMAGQGEVLEGGEGEGGRRGRRKGVIGSDKASMKAPGPAPGDSEDTQRARYQAARGALLAGWSSQAGPRGHAVSGSPSGLAFPLASQ